jgi:spectinomycin phosphotransferase
MRTPPTDVTEAEVTDALARCWATTVADLRYFPEGGGAHHWTALDDEGHSWFVTCDDLDTKAWLGSDRDTVFEGLQRSYETAAGLRRSGLRFVSAPVASLSGSPAERLDERHSLAMSEFVHGAPGQWGRPMGEHARREVVSMLAALHGSARPPRAIVHTDLEVAGRAALEAALDDLGRSWVGGPFSESARKELRTHAGTVARSLERLDAIASGLEASGSDAVVTHGEPHAGNLIRASGGLMLVDWDTVAIARPERDLWMLDSPTEPVSTAYRRLTGRTIRPDALRAYRSLWALADIAAFTTQLRKEHNRDADGEKALAGLRSILGGSEPAPYGGTRSSALV